MELPNCRFFHYDAFRGREVMLCRLLERAGQSDRWSLKLCQSCPVPTILSESRCAKPMVEGEVLRRFGLFPRVVPFVACGVAMQRLDDPLRCPTCEQRAAPGG